jgi:hypothetical protein
MLKGESKSGRDRGDGANVEARNNIVKLLTVGTALTTIAVVVGGRATVWPIRVRYAASCVCVLVAHQGWLQSVL